MKKSCKTLIGLTIILVAFTAAAFCQQQPPQAVNNQDETVNIQAPPQMNKDGVMTIFRSGDKKEVYHYISRVVPLEHAKGAEIWPHVNNAVKMEKGNSRVLKYTPPGSDKAKEFIQVVTTREQMPSVVETIKMLDRKNVRSDLGTTLTSIRLKYRLASDMKKVIDATTITGEGLSFADDKSNTIHFQDSLSDSEYTISVLDFFDVPPPQVEFDIQVIETRQKNSEDIGLDWMAWKRNLGGQLDISGNVFEGGEAFSRLDWLLTLDPEVLASFLNYAVDEGSAELVHRTRVTGNNINPAVLSYSRPVRYYDYENTYQSPSQLTESNPDVTADGEGAAGNRIVNTVPPSRAERILLDEYHEGMVITIDPVIGSEMVTARVYIDANFLSGYDEQDRPILTEQHYESEVTLQDGGSLRLGAIEKEREIEYRSGIPYLKDIPLVKRLFSVKTKRTEESRLHIIASPRYVNNVIYGQKQTLSQPGITEVLDQKLPVDIETKMMQSE